MPRRTPMSFTTAELLLLEESLMEAMDFAYRDGRPLPDEKLAVVEALLARVTKIREIAEDLEPV